MHERYTRLRIPTFILQRMVLKEVPGFEEPSLIFFEKRNNSYKWRNDIHVNSVVHPSPMSTTSQKKLVRGQQFH